MTAMHEHHKQVRGRSEDSKEYQNLGRFAGSPSFLPFFLPCVLSDMAIGTGDRVQEETTSLSENGGGLSLVLPMAGTRCAAESARSSKHGARLAGRGDG